MFQQAKSTLFSLFRSNPTIKLLITDSYHRNPIPWLLQWIQTYFSRSFTDLPLKKDCFITSLIARNAPLKMARECQRYAQLNTTTARNKTITTLYCSYCNSVKNIKRLHQTTNNQQLYFTHTSFFRYRPQICINLLEATDHNHFDTVFNWMLIVTPGSEKWLSKPVKRYNKTCTIRRIGFYRINNHDKYRPCSICGHHPMD